MSRNPVVFPVRNAVVRWVGNFLIRWMQWSCLLLGLALFVVFLVVHAR